MALLIYLAIVGAVVAGIYKYLTEAEARQHANREFAADPLLWIWIAIGLALFSAFIVGVLVPPIGTIKVTVWHRKTMELWQIGGIGSVVWTGIMLFVARKLQ